jgi:hypothetical protein
MSVSCPNQVVSSHQTIQTNMNQAATEQISHTSGIYNTQGPTRNSALYGDETETVVALSKEVPQMPPPPLAQLPLSHGYFTGPAGAM